MIDLTISDSEEEDDVNKGNECTHQLRVPDAVTARNSEKSADEARAFSDYTATAENYETQLNSDADLEMETGEEKSARESGDSDCSDNDTDCVGGVETHMDDYDDAFHWDEYHNFEQDEEEADEHQGTCGPNQTTSPDQSFW